MDKLTQELIQRLLHAVSAGLRYNNFLLEISKLEKLEESKVCDGSKILYSDKLDTLYEDWISKSYLAVEKAKEYESKTL